MVLTNVLKKNKDFQHVYKKGKSLANKHIVIFVLKNRENTNRLGISASKKVGGAVVRNKQRRRLKEAYRALETWVLPGHDIVILPRVGIVDISFTEMISNLRHLLRKHGIWRQHG